MKIGAVLFDDPYIAKEGWASDGNEVVRINGIGALSSDTVWVTNVYYPQWKSLSLDNTPNILHTQYMRSRLIDISREIGLSTKEEQAVVEIAKILNRVKDMGQSAFGVDLSTPGYRYTTLIQDRVIPVHMRAAPEATVRQRIYDACKQSTQENQAMSNKKVPSGSTAHSFIFPRATYSKWILSQPVPISNKWKEIKHKESATIIGTHEGEVIKGTKAVIKRLLEIGEKNAVLMKIAVKYTDKMNRDFATYGVGANHVRGWATLPEILTLSKYCTLELQGGFLTELGHFDVLDKIETMNEEFSYSRGIFLENLWVALATPKFKGASTVYTAAGAYLRAYDRAMCYKVAEKISLDGGYTVGSYGAGRVQVYLRDGEIDSFNDMAISLGVIPQLGMREEAERL